MTLTATSAGAKDGLRSGLLLAAIVLALVAAFGGLPGGPALGDHEALVAECARQMRLTGDWVVPHFLDTPFIRKPPLGYWLVAAASYLFPPDEATGLPVNEGAARLPSALAALGTVLLLWRLASGMFGRRAGVVAAVMASASLFVLLYGVNATVEMLLTFCCTWAFAHFWWAQRTHSAGRRFVHMMLFYLAFGMAMLAKGPAPVALLAAPIAWWWFTQRAQMVVGRAPRLAGAMLVRSAGQQTVRAFTRLWVIPGVILFLAVFVPWMLAVARQEPHAWDLWNWQYLQRMQGDYTDTRPRGYFYYIPMLLGLLVPWTPALIEAVVAPWMPRYRRGRRALYFVGCWAVVGVLMMSLMSFKKPYYILPAMPGFVLLMTPVLERYLQAMRLRRLAGGLNAAVIAVALLATVGALVLFATDRLQGVTEEALLMVIVGGITCAAAAWLCRLRRVAAGLLALAFGTTATFFTGWYAIGPDVDSMERTTALDAELDEVGVPSEGPVYWADQRPDSRLGFYYGRASEHLLDPAEIVTRMTDRTKGKRTLESMAHDRAMELLASAHPVYFILDRKNLPTLQQLPPEIAHRVQVIGTVDLDGKPDGDDWVIVSNGSAQTSQGHRHARHVAWASANHR